MEIQVLKQNGSKDSKLTLPDKIFSQSFNADLVHQLLSTYIFNGHQNTKSQKNRSRARGGGRKPWRQKGTGELEQDLLEAPYGEGAGSLLQKCMKKKERKKSIRKCIGQP